jgi:predicted membrane protein
LSGFKEIQYDHPFPIPKGSANHFTRWGQRHELFLLWGIHMSPLHGVPFWLRLVVVTPRHVTGDEIQETVTFSLVLVQ